MAFDYNKHKHSEGNDSFWTSYSDLFLGLSTIFLMLYVVSSLRTGTDAVRNQIDNQKLSMQVEELQNQLKMYESVKANYLEKTASKDEQQEYQELMDKLTLLQDEAKNEKERLLMDSRANADKEKALNKYQQMVRNVLNANSVAKSRIVTRNDIIGEQDVKIDDQKQNITQLETDVTKKERLIEEGKRKIADGESELKKNMQALKRQFERNKMTKKAYEKQVKQTKENAEKHLAHLRSQNGQYSQQLNQASQKLTQLNSELQNTQNALTQKSNEAQGLQTELAKAANEANGLKGQIGSLKNGFANQQAADRAAFDGEMKKLKLGAAQRAQREAQFRAEAEGKAKALSGKLQGLEGKLRETEGALGKAKEEIDARKSVADEIRRGFQKAGIKADVDGQTGEVVIDFGDAYFENDSSNMKQEMKAVLQKALPIYSSSLFGNPKLAGKISTVEVVGFASPTYKGRYVDPQSNKPEDRAAIKYNMDLSYRRANAIFQYVVDDKKEFAHQKNLLGLMKVSGRSFLEGMKVNTRNLANDADFCKLNDCKKAQRVIVRFSMDGKK